MNKPKSPKPRMIKHGCVVLLIIPLSVVISCALVMGAHADDTRKGRCAERSDHTNYIIRRQQDYSVRGTPSLRIYSHGRKIDVYRDGTAFERDHVVGVRSR